MNRDPLQRGIANDRWDSESPPRGGRSRGQGGEGPEEKWKQQDVGDSSSNEDAKSSSHVLLQHKEHQGAIQSDSQISALNVKRILPENYIPSTHSVVTGRGKFCTEASGSKRLKAIAATFLDEYAKAGTKRKKSLIVSKIFKLVEKDCPDGEAFIKLEGGRWWEVDESTAREKVGYVLRNLLHDKYRSSTKSKAIKRRLDLSITKEVGNDQQSSTKRQDLDEASSQDSSSLSAKSAMISSSSPSTDLLHRDNHRVSASVHSGGGTSGSLVEGCNSPENVGRRDRIVKKNAADSTNYPKKTSIEKTKTRLEVKNLSDQNTTVETKSSTTTMDSPSSKMTVSQPDNNHNESFQGTGDTNDKKFVEEDTKNTAVSGPMDNYTSHSNYSNLTPPRSIMEFPSHQAPGVAPTNQHSISLRPPAQEAMRGDGASSSSAPSISWRNILRNSSNDYQTTGFILQAEGPGTGTVALGCGDTATNASSFSSVGGISMDIFGNSGGNNDSTNSNPLRIIPPEGGHSMVDVQTSASLQNFIGDAMSSNEDISGLFSTLTSSNNSLGTGGREQADAAAAASLVNWQNWTQQISGNVHIPTFGGISKQYSLQNARLDPYLPGTVQGGAPRETRLSSDLRSPQQLPISTTGGRSQTSSLITSNYLGNSSTVQMEVDFLEGVTGTIGGDTTPLREDDLSDMFD